MRTNAFAHIHARHALTLWIIAHHAMKTELIFSLQKANAVNAIHHARHALAQKQTNA
jgi:hypothetical protein